MAKNPVDDIEGHVETARRQLNELKIDYRRAAIEDAWTLSESVCYLIGISPYGIVANKIQIKGSTDNYGLSDLSLLKIAHTINQYKILIIKAIQAKILRTAADLVVDNDGYVDCILYPGEVISWATNKGMYVNNELLSECEKYRIANESSLTQHLSTVNRKRRKRDQRIEYILTVIDELKFDRRKIPYGGKTTIKNHCLLNDPNLFTEATFGHAWTAGLSNNSFRLLNHEKYSSTRKGKGMQ